MTLPLEFTAEVRAALEAGHPVVALESTIITHGMPVPQNVEAARAVEAEVRKGGAVPATIAVMGGRIHIGLSDAALDQLGQTPHAMKLSRADLRVAPASPGKAERLLPLLAHPGATLYVNLEEARLICAAEFATAAEAAEGMLARGAHRVLVTHGGEPCAEGTAGLGVITDSPPPVLVTRITGAGDTFMAAHIVAERRGVEREAALAAALRAAATYVSGEIGS